MGQLACSKKQHYNQTFAMALGSHACRSSCVNTPADPAGKLDDLAGQSSAKRSNIVSNEAPTKAPTLLEATTLYLVPPLSKNFFTKFMKVFMETTQA